MCCGKQLSGEHEMKKYRSIFLPVMIFFTGLCLLVYPTFSNYYNSLHQTGYIASYNSAMKEISTEDIQAAREAAEDYNEQLLHQRTSRFKPTKEQHTLYNSLLGLSDIGVIGYIEIPRINVNLPVYHGTGEDVLRTGVGHVEGSSLPVGGKGTHCVLSGHRGLPTARLFTDLNDLAVGDTFCLQVLADALTYEVDQILTVAPDEVAALEIEPGKDLCTLVTCTPYGVNTDRLLVRGHRIETRKKLRLRITADAYRIDPVLVAPVIAVPILLILMIGVLVRKPR